MAQIKFGLVVTDARGKAGGVVFSKGRSGAILRVKTSIVNKVSPFQAALRNQTNILMKRFSFVLSDAQRQQWAAFASDVKSADVFGDVRSITPINLYVKCNTVRHQAWREFPNDVIFNGIEFLDDPPGDVSVGDFNLSINDIFFRGLVDDFFSIGFGMPDAFNVAGHTLVMQCTGPLKGGVLNFEKKFRFLTSFADLFGGNRFTQEFGNFGRHWGDQPNGTLVAGKLGILNVSNGFTRFGPTFKVGLT